MLIPTIGRNYVVSNEIRWESSPSVSAPARVGVFREFLPCVLVVREFLDFASAHPRRRPRSEYEFPARVCQNQTHNVKTQQTSRLRLCSDARVLASNPARSIWMPGRTRNRLLRQLAKSDPD